MQPWLPHRCPADFGGVAMTREAHETQRGEGGHVATQQQRDMAKGADSSPCLNQLARPPQPKRHLPCDGPLCMVHITYSRCYVHQEVDRGSHPRLVFLSSGRARCVSQSCSVLLRQPHIMMTHEGISEVGNFFPYKFVAGF